MRDTARWRIPAGPAITEWELVPLLLDEGWIDLDELAGLAITDISRRNRVFRVERPDGSGFLLKQGCDARAARGVAREAAVYRRLTAPGAPGAIARRVPRLLGYASRPGVLALELLPGARSAGDLADPAEALAPPLAAALGETLAALHTLPPDGGAALRPRVFDVGTPDLDMFRTASAGGIEIFRRAQASREWGAILHAAGRDWTPAALIHHDLRLDNLLLPPSPMDPRALRIIDWEMAGPGDPRWDVGWVIGEYLGAWLRWLPDADGVALDRLAPHGLVPIAAVGRAVRAFLEGYRRLAGIEPQTTGGWDSVLRFAAARLLQLAFEEAQHAWRVPQTSAHALAIGAELGTRPVEAARRWLEVGS